jgi:hypothetical protein
MGQLDPKGDLFLARVTDVEGTGAGAAYGFEEVNVIGGEGGIEARVSGRTGSPDANPGRWAGGGTLSVGDLVLARRNVADLNEYEILTFVGRAEDVDDGSSSSSSGGGASFCFVVHRNPRCVGTDIEYDEVTVCLYGGVFGEEL